MDRTHPLTIFEKRYKRLLLLLVPFLKGAWLEGLLLLLLLATGIVAWRCKKFHYDRTTLFVQQGVIFRRKQWISLSHRTLLCRQSLPDRLFRATHWVVQAPLGKRRKVLISLLIDASLATDLQSHAGPGQMLRGVGGWLWWESWQCARDDLGAVRDYFGWFHRVYTADLGVRWRFAGVGRTQWFRHLGVPIGRYAVHRGCSRRWLVPFSMGILAAGVQYVLHTPSFLFRLGIVLLFARALFLLYAAPRNEAVRYPGCWLFRVNGHFTLKTVLVPDHQLAYVTLWGGKMLKKTPSRICFQAQGGAGFSYSFCGLQMGDDL